MFDPKKIINDITEQVKKCLPSNLSHLSEEVEKNVKTALDNAFNKMNLVTREEFEAQTKVLERTRAKLELLERQLEELEKRYK